MSENQYENRSDRFADLRDNKPSPGGTLTHKDFQKVKIEVIFKGNKRIMFANAEIDKEATGWYLTNKPQGLRCLIAHDDQEQLIKNNMGSTKDITVSSLRVVRINPSQRSLICEVIEKNKGYS